MNELDPTPRILLGPGPSTVPPRVLRAMSAPMIGYLDPQLMVYLGEIQSLLRMVFQTGNEWTFPISGTGTAGMETSLVNFIEPGDDVLVLVNGYFGARLAEIAARHRAQVDILEHPWGQVFTSQEVEAALQRKRYKLLALVHMETSTGTLQPQVDEIAVAAHRHGALVVLDTVASLGGAPVRTDAWDVDIVYSGSQKCLSAPPGLAPITISERARQVLDARQTPVDTWYLDLALIARYWGEAHAYHHTPPISSLYGLRESLRLIAEEGLEACLTRHQHNAERLWDGLEALGLDFFIPREYRSPTLSTPLVPAGVDELAVRRALLQEYNLEIAGGFGPLAGKIWRVGLMGYSSARANVDLLLTALQHILDTN